VCAFTLVVWQYRLETFSESVQIQEERHWEHVMDYIPGGWSRVFSKLLQQTRSKGSEKSAVLECENRLFPFSNYFAEL